MPSSESFVCFARIKVDYIFCIFKKSVVYISMTLNIYVYIFLYVIGIYIYIYELQDKSDYYNVQYIS